MTGERKIPREETATLFRFLLVGGAFSLGYSVVTSALINLAGAPPFLTSVLVYAACIPAAFLMQKRFAFRIERTRWSAFAIYTATQLCGLALVSIVTTRFVTHNFAIDTGLFLVTVGFAAVLNFLIGRFVTFRP